MRTQIFLMIVKHHLCLLFCLLSSVLMAQNLKGTIKNAAGEGIPSATISALNSNIETVSDQSGQYELSLGTGSFQLEIRALGFASKIAKVEISGSATQLDVTLEESTTTLDEAVVSANKREEALLDVAVSISSLSAQKVENTRTWGLGGLTALVPNYLYQELGSGFQQLQSIRGIQVFSENPAVATYVDDVNNLDILANGYVLTDIERIEVLRGPQGTLFGRNAMGGVVNIYTKKPGNKTQGYAELGTGNLGLQRYGAGIKTPLIKDKLFLGLNGILQSRDGYWINDTTGTKAVDGSAQGKSVGGEKNLYGNAYLSWLPSSRFSATLNVKGQRDWSDNTGFFVSLTRPDKLESNFYNLYLARVGEHEWNIVTSALTMKYFGDAFSVTSISALQNITMAFQDVDFPGFYHSFHEKEIGEKLPPQKVWSQEVRISSRKSNSRLKYTAGVYAFGQVGYEPSTNLAFELAPGFYSVFRNKSDNNGVALFGELSFQISEKLKATLGARYDNENRESTFNGFGDASFAAGQLTFLKPDTTVGGKYTAFSPKLALSYALGAQSNLYLSYTRGFRAGGVNASKLPAGIRQKFDPEYSNNYELGYKVLAAENRFSLNFSAFLIQWRDLQFYNLVAPFTYARENVGDARSQGIELETSYIPVKGLQLDASLGLNATEYVDFSLTRVNFFTGEEVKTPVGGNKLSNSPAHTLFLGAQYVLPIAPKFTALLRAEFRNIGKFYTDIQNALAQDPYSLINTNLVLTYDKYSLAFWTQNLNNAKYLAFGTADTSFGYSVRTAAPRTLGLTLSAKF